MLRKRLPHLNKRKSLRSNTACSGYQKPRRALYKLPYLSEFKKFCHQCLHSLQIEKGLDIKKDSLLKLVYSAETDVVYLYLNDAKTSMVLMETLNHWLLNTDPMFMGTTIDTNEEDIFVIELNYMDKEMIQQNLKEELKTIAV